MKTVTAFVDFDILTYWHAGTGKGAGPEADALVFRTPAGLPCIPGRTVKGVLRDAMDRAEACGELRAGTVVRWLGSDIVQPAADDSEAREATLESMRFSTQEGRLRFDSAVLFDDSGSLVAWEHWAASRQQELRHLFARMSSTAIDESELASDATLRTIEVAVPMKLRARVDGPSDGEWVSALRAATPFLHSLCSHRHRGYGRVKVEVVQP